MKLKMRREKDEAKGRGGSLTYAQVVTEALSTSVDT